MSSSRSNATSSSQRSTSLAPPAPRRNRNNSAVTLESSRSSKSSGSGKSSSVRSRSKSEDTPNRQPRFPRISVAHPENPKEDEDCVVFLAELYEFLLETYRFGISRSGKLHPEVTKFIDNYGTRVMYSVQVCTQRICQNRPIFDKVVSYKPHVFADIIHLCTKHLTGRIRLISKKSSNHQRSKDEQLMDEMFAAPFLSLLMLINSPKADPNYAKECLNSCYGDLVNYLLLIPHHCTQTAECNCYKNAGPIETAIEEACLPAGGKYTPSHLLNAIHQIDRHYDKAISFNYVLALSILMMKGQMQPIISAFPKVVFDLKCLLKNNKETSRSVLIVRTGVGQYVAQGQASDFVVVCLDMILKRLATKQPSLFNRESVNVIEQYYIEKRPMSCLLALEVLKVLAKTRPDLVAGKRKKYRAVADDLELPDDQIDALEVFT